MQSSSIAGRSGRSRRTPTGTDGQEALDRPGSRNGHTIEVMFPVSLSAFRRLTRAAVVFLAVIVVSGGAVRLTGSGLGCPTWPQCGDGSFVTRPEFQIHGLIELGKRGVTLIVGLT